MKKLFLVLWVVTVSQTWAAEKVTVLMGEKSELGVVSIAIEKAKAGTVPAPTARKQCYSGKTFNGFPCEDGGRWFTSKGHSTLLK